MGPLLLALMLATPVPTVGDAPSAAKPVAVSFSGRFAPGGKNVATMRLEAPSVSNASAPIARILTDDCRSTASPVALGVNPQQPLAVVDLDGDGLDEVFLYLGGATIDAVGLIRTDGCEVVTVRKDGAPAELPFHGRSNGCAACGVGIRCTRTPDGTVDIVATAHEPWSAGELEGEDSSIEVQERVRWKRTTYALRGDSLVVIATDTGTTKIHDAPTAPLLNRFDCFGSVYPPE